MPVPPSLLPLPPEALARRITSWSQVRPWVEDLVAAPLEAATLDAWVLQWDVLNQWINDTGSRLYAEAAADSRDEGLQAALRSFEEGIQPPADEAFQALSLKLLGSGLGGPDLQQTLRRFRAWSEIFRTENLPLQVRLSGLANDYHRLHGRQLVPFQGQEHTLEGLQTFFVHPDRTLREGAWRAAQAIHQRDRTALDGLFDSMADLRIRVAAQAGFQRYVDFSFVEHSRFEVTPQGCVDFQDSIAATVVPLARKAAELRRRLLGVDAVEPWDAEVDLFGPVAMLPAQDLEALQAGVSEVLHRACPGPARHFDRMRDLGTLDLGDRPGKQGGGFCATFPLARTSYILMTANGTPSDVFTLAHEGGHAVHFMEAMERQPLDFQVYPPADCCEAVAIAMELLVLPHLGRFYTPQDCARVRLKRLLEIPRDLAYIAAIDAFQHWAYDHVDAGREGRDAAAAAIAERFCPGLGWERHPEYQATFWQRKEHVFILPFYYINYAFADLGALQVWRNGARDAAAAGAGLARAMALGSTVSRADFFTAGGAEFRWDREMLSELMGALERAISAELRTLGHPPLGSL